MAKAMIEAAAEAAPTANEYFQRGNDYSKIGDYEKAMPTTTRPLGSIPSMPRPTTNSGYS